jgi:chitinase
MFLSLIVLPSASAKPGPNAPFYNACHNSSQPGASAVSAFTAWIAAGFLPSQLTLGLPFYGYVSQTTASSLRNRGTLQQNSSTVVLHGEGGQISFRGLVEQGALEVSSSPSGARRFTAAGGFERGWDACSGTPFLRSMDAEQVVAYDDPDSLGAKALFVKQAGMRGVDVWEIHGDTDDWALTDAVGQALGRI